MKKNPRVTIPASELSKQLAQTRVIKDEMTKLLAELELASVKKPPSRVGGWRQDPIAWERGHDLN
jgi:hypothetical protein